MKKLVFAMGALFAISACDKKAEPAKEGEKAAEGKAAEGGEKAAAGDSGAPTCDKYIKTMEACLAKLPEAAQGPAKDALKQTQDGWKAVTDKGALEAACKTAWDTGKQAMGAMCPDVKWE
jgi:hypothetical protein